MMEDFESAVEYVANMLMYRVEATPVEGEEINLPVGPGPDGEYKMWSAQTTTYTLGLMLSGALSIERERRLSDGKPA